MGVARSMHDRDEDLIQNFSQKNLREETGWKTFAWVMG